MKFNSKEGQELRTWILFLLGIGLVIFFAWKRNPLNPWWTLIIGGFTCATIIISAVQSIMTGIADTARKVSDEAKRNNPNRDSEKPNDASYSTDLGYSCIRLIRRICCRHPNTIQSA